MHPTRHRPRSATGLGEAFALPAGSALLLGLGTLVAITGGGFGAAALLVATGVVVAAGAARSDPVSALVLGLVGWLVANGFAAAPYGELRPGTRRAAEQAIVIATCAAGGALIGVARELRTGRRNGSTLEGVLGLAGLAGAVAPRRRIYAVAVAACGFPLLTWALTALRGRLDLADDLLIYLVLVVAVSVVGGLWPAVAAAVVSGLLLNWFFTEPVHTFTISRPDNLLALLLFVVVAVTVSSLVHLSARRAELAAQSRNESEALLQLARLVLAGHDSPAAILEHMHRTVGPAFELQEKAGGHWVRLASAGAVAGATTGPGSGEEIGIREDLRLVVSGSVPPERRRIVQAAAGQCAAALDRERLRTQAAQAEALAAGNRMRTALLAAVSHDLRTPLASLKASVSSLRQTDVTWSPADEAELLENVEESTDRLTELIASLLDMSRITTGALQPYLRPAVVEEVLPGALAGLAGQDTVTLDVPGDLPLVLTDPGLLERALANLVSNALRHSPAGRPPAIVCRVAGPARVDIAGDERVSIAVVDHGPGVAPAQRDAMFQPFQRLGDQHPGTGVGLGLAVARGFVESLGGTLVATGTPGGGLTMTISIPAAPAMSPVPSTP